MSRLEEIKRLWEENNDFPVDPAEYEWLISRVEELERNNKALEESRKNIANSFSSVWKQNQRYKQALDFYAKHASKVDEVYVKAGLYNKLAEDCGKIAQQALKGESDD